MPEPTPTDSLKTLSCLRLLLAFAIAVSSDGFSFFTSAAVIATPVVIAVDMATALLLWWTLGRPSWLLVVFVAEAIPGLGMVPFWTLVVGAIALTGRVPRAMQARAEAPPPPPLDQAP